MTTTEPKPKRMRNPDRVVIDVSLASANVLRLHAASYGVQIRDAAASLKDELLSAQDSLCKSADRFAASEEARRTALQQAEDARKASEASARDYVAIAWPISDLAREMGWDGEQEHGPAAAFVCMASRRYRDKVAEIEAEVTWRGVEIADLSQRVAYHAKAEALREEMADALQSMSAWDHARAAVVKSGLGGRFVAGCILISLMANALKTVEIVWGMM